MKKLLLIAFIFVFTLSTLPSQSATKAFQYAAKDGFNMTGNIYLPKAPAGKKVPLVILLHAIGSSKADWKNLPDLITGKGYACLALDLRGHGQSVLNAKLKQRSWMYFTNTDYAKYPQDVLLAVEAVKTEYAKKIDTNRIIFVGSHIGVNTAVIAASKLNRKGPVVKSIVMISPKVSIKGLFIPIELVNFGVHPILIFSNKNSKNSYYETLEIKKYTQGECVIKTLNSYGTGSALYKSTPSIKTDTVNWIAAKFGKP